MSPAGTLTIYGHWYTSTCNDTGGHDPLVPLPPVRLVVHLPGGTVLHAGPFSPHGPDLGFHAVVPLPAGTPKGVVTVRDDRDLAATVTVRIAGPSAAGSPGLAP